MCAGRGLGHPWPPGHHSMGTPSRVLVGWGGGDGDGGGGKVRSVPIVPPRDLLLLCSEPSELRDRDAKPHRRSEIKHRLVPVVTSPPDLPQKDPGLLQMLLQCHIHVLRADLG